MCQCGSKHLYYTVAHTYLATPLPPKFQSTFPDFTVTGMPAEGKKRRYGPGSVEGRAVCGDAGKNAYDDTSLVVGFCRLNKSDKSRGRDAIEVFC